MKKGEISTMLIVVISLVVILLSGAIIFAMFGSFGEEIDRTTGITTVQSWLLLKVQAEDISKGFAKTSSRPPIAELSEPIIIDNKNQLASIDGEPPEAAVLIGDAMVDCWDAFHRGEIGFSNKGPNEKDVFCFSCAGVETKDLEIKEQNYGLRNFKEYLNTTTISAMDDRTYIEYLSNINEDYNYLVPDYLKFNEDLYVYFVGHVNTPLPFTFEICTQTENNEVCEAIKEGKDLTRSTVSIQGSKGILAPGDRPDWFNSRIILGNAKTINYFCDERSLAQDQSAAYFEYHDSVQRDCKGGLLAGKPLTMACS